MKKQKSKKTPATPMLPRQAAPLNEPLLITVNSVNAASSKTGHHECSRVHDLRPFRDGRPHSRRGPSFSGRPNLALQVASAIQSLVNETNPARETICDWIKQLTPLWLFLDEYERANPSTVRIDSIEQLPGAVWISFCFALEKRSPNWAAQIYSTCSRIFGLATPSCWPASAIPAQPFLRVAKAARRDTTDPYPPETLEEMKRAFRAERFSLLQRFDEANALADSGEPASTTLDRHLNRAGLTQQDIWTPANTLGFVRSELLPTLANKGQIRSRYSIWPAAIGMAPNVPLPANLEGHPSRGVGFGNRAGLVGLYRHFVPTFQDLVPFAAEIMCLEGWNPQCVMDLDRNSCLAATIDGDLMSLQARKARASGKLVTSLTRTDPNSIFDIVSTAIRITAPLHACVEAELASMTTTALTAADQSRLDFLKSLCGRRSPSLRA